MTIEVGSMIKITPELFGTDPKESDLYGDLGYPGILRHCKFQIVRIENDAARGQVAYCTVMNPNDLIGIDGIKEVEYEGECLLLLKDVVAAITIITLDYVICETPVIDKNVMVTELFDKRAKLKSAGRQVASTDMKENWALIQKLRAEIAKGFTKVIHTEAKVYLPKQRLTLTVSTTELPNERDEASVAKFRQLLVKRLKAMRKSRKTTNPTSVTNRTYFGQNLTLIGGVFTEGGQPVKAYEKSLITTLRSEKIPKNKKHTYVGVEIEFIHLNNDPGILDELFIQARLHKNVQLTNDGSVKPCHNANGYKGSELRILATVDDFPEVIAKVCKVLTDYRVDGYVNRSCGLHVHLDVRDRDASVVYTNLVRAMALLKGSQPVGRTTSKFCVPNKYDDIDKHQDGLEASKYLVVNPRPFHDGRGTVEVRVHEGSVDAEAITNWVMFLNTIANKQEVIANKKYNRAKDLNKAIALPAACINYIDSRIEKFGHGA